MPEIFRKVQKLILFADYSAISGWYETKIAEPWHGGGLGKAGGFFSFTQVV